MDKITSKSIVILSGIILIALLLRVPGLFWGYNLFGDGKSYILNIDERHHALVAEEYFKGIDYDQFYVRGFGSQIAIVLGLGKFISSSVEINSQYLYAIGRLIALLYGLATIILIYFFSRELFEDQAISLLSSLFLALSWIHVAFSHIGVPDTAALFWTYFSFFFILRYAKKPDDLNLILAAIGAGFSIGIKIALLTLVPLFIILLVSDRRLYHGLLIFFVLIGSFELINVFSYTPQSFLSTRYMMLSDALSGVKMNKLINLPCYLLLLLPSLGLPVCLLSGWGIFKLFENQKLKGISFKSLLLNKYFLVSAPMFLHLYLILNGIVNVTRYLLPLIPLLAVFAAFGLTKLIKPALSGRAFKGAVIAIIIYQLVQIISIEQATVFDSRKIMGKWMKENISPTAVISTGPTVEYNIVPSIFTTARNFDADYIVLHSCFYSRYLTGGYGFKDTYPQSCSEIVHCWGGDETRQTVQDLFQGKTEYALLKKVEMNFVTPEMLLIKALFGPRLDGYGSYTGDTVIFKKKAGISS